MNTFEPELFKGRMRGSSEGETHKGKMVPRCQSLAIFSTPRGARFCIIKGDGVPFQGYSESDSQRPMHGRDHVIYAFASQLSSTIPDPQLGVGKYLLNE